MLDEYRNGTRHQLTCWLRSTSVEKCEPFESTALKVLQLPSLKTRHGTRRRRLNRIQYNTYSKVGSE